MDLKQKMNGLPEFPFPGVQVEIDGNEAIARLESDISQGGFFYPFALTDRMCELYFDQISTKKKNIWNDEIISFRTNSSADAASCCEGFVLSGGRAVCFTSGDELVAMKKILTSISGKRLPMVIHAGTRALTTHSSTLHTGHDDVMGVNDCGWGMLFAQDVQETLDLALIARKASEESYTPFFNVQDGYLTTHSKEKIFFPEKKLIKKFIGNAEEILVNLFNPEKPFMTGAVQNPDSFMKGKIAQRDYYEKIPSILNSAFDEFYKLTGRKYNFIKGYKLEDAEYAVIGLGNGIKQVVEICDYLRNELNIKAGALHITSYRPFPKDDIINSLPNVKAVTVIERVDNPLAHNNPLTLEVKSAFLDGFNENIINSLPEIYSCTYGLGGRKITHDEIISLYNNMIKDGKKNYAVGVEHSYSID